MVKSGPLIRTGSFVVAVACMVASLAWCQVATFSDTEFLDVDWQSEKIHDTSLNQAGTFTAHWQATGGNPGACRAVTHSWCGEADPINTIWVAHLKTDAVFVPLDTAIVMDFRIDGLFSPVVDPFAVGCGPLLYQDGSYYHVYDAIVIDQWRTASFDGLRRENFGLTPGSTGFEHPDFSPGAAPIQFGFFTQNGTQGTGCLVTNSRYDNWSFTIETDPLSDTALALAAPCLYDNVPNPFNPMTTIRYDLPTLCRVTLLVYDLSGRLIRTLKHGVVEDAGHREVVWNGTDNSGLTVSSGVYFYCLTAGEYTETRRMVLLK